MMAHHANEIAKSQLSVVMRQPFRQYDCPSLALDQKEPAAFRPSCYGESSPAIQAASPRLQSHALPTAFFVWMAFPERGSRVMLTGRQAGIKRFTALSSDAICALLAKARHDLVEAFMRGLHTVVVT